MALCYFNFYPDDWLADVGHLNFEEQGVYLRIMCLLWKQGRQTGTPSLPADDGHMARAVGVPVPKWRKLKAILVDDRATAVLTVKAGILTQKRLTAEWNKAVQAYERMSEGGRKGMESRWGDPENTPENDNPLNKEATNPLTNPPNKEAYKGGHKGDHKGPITTRARPRSQIIERKVGDASYAGSPARTSSNGKGKRAVTTMPSEPPEYTEEFRKATEQMHPGTEPSVVRREWYAWHAHHLAKGDPIANLPGSWRSWMLSRYWDHGSASDVEPMEPALTPDEIERREDERVAREQEAIRKQRERDGLPPLGYGGPLT